MNIGIDAIAAVGQSGNGRYSRELIRALLAEDTKDTFFLFSFLHQFYKKSLFADTHSTYKERYVYVSKPYYPFSNAAEVNEKLVTFTSSINKVDLFHFTNPLNFLLGPYKSVVTIHDLAALHAEHSWVKESSAKEFPRIMESITKHADAIIAVSEYTKKDLIEFLGIAPERITVVYEAADAFFYPEPAEEELANAFGIRDYVLYTGQLQPRKNILTLVRAWAKYIKSDAYEKDSAQTKLVLAGGARDAAYRIAVEECIRTEGVTDSVVLTGSVDEATLRKLYSNARCFIYPSLFEGFGLPILEALQCGTPVIASNITSLPEVVGNAGLLVDPNDTDDISRALSTMLGNAAVRESFKQKAIAQAARFSWKKAAQETLSVYTQNT